MDVIVNVLRINIKEMVNIDILNINKDKNVIKKFILVVIVFIKMYMIKVDLIILFLFVFF